MGVLERRAAERRVVQRYLDDLASAGWFVYRVECEGEPLQGDEDDLFSADEVVVYLRRSRRDSLMWSETGWLHFLYGHDPAEVLVNHAPNLGPYIEAASAYAELGGPALGPVHPDTDPRALAEVFSALDALEEANGARIIGSIVTQRVVEAWARTRSPHLTPLERAQAALGGPRR